MSQKILGIDLGTGSVGVSLRNPDIQGTITDQLEYFSVDEYEGGVDKAGVSRAANRTKSRLTRRLYDTRRRRLWETLKLLIEYDLCPLSKESLNRWMIYDKTCGGYSHQYPIEDKAFEQWIKLDFDNNGIVDYTSPYHLRRDLAQKENQLNLNKSEDRYKLGRALYHIAQRRGFKSSKGSNSSIEDDIENESEIALSEVLESSETKKNKILTEYMDSHDCATVACAFADLIDNGIRIRASQYEAVRSDYKKEIKTIFEIQDQLSLDSDLFRRLISEKKGEGTIFYKKKPTGKHENVGKCTLEQTKTRCPICHPVYEEFRALSFINNIRFRKSTNSDWKCLTPEQSTHIYKKFFTSRVKKTFKFEEIRKYLEELFQITFNKEQGTINYSDSVSIAGCPITARMINLFGDDWDVFSIEGKKQRKNQAKTGTKFHIVKYTADSIWNFCFNADEPEEIEFFAKNCLSWGDKQTKTLVRLWDDMQLGYAMLSQKAMKNINRFLRYGLKYSDAVLLAKFPELLNKHGYIITEKEIQDIINEYPTILQNNSSEKSSSLIANTLISSYKALDYTERFADRDYNYSLQGSDIMDVKDKCKHHFGEKRWSL